MSLAEIILKTRDEDWDTGYYMPSPNFLAIDAHVAVMRSEGRALIGITGPTGDRESRMHARLMAMAPDMGRLLLQIFEHGLNEVNRVALEDLLNVPLDDALEVER